MRLGRAVPKVLGLSIVETIIAPQRPVDPLGTPRAGAQVAHPRVLLLLPRSRTRPHRNAPHPYRYQPDSQYVAWDARAASGGVAAQKIIHTLRGLRGRGTQDARHGNVGNRRDQNRYAQKKSIRVHSVHASVAKLFTATCDPVSTVGLLGHVDETNFQRCVRTRSTIPHADADRSSNDILPPFLHPGVRSMWTYIRWRPRR